MLKKIGIGVLLLFFLAAFVLWRWTHTPYGRMDVGPAVLAHVMGLRQVEFTPAARVEANAYIARFMGCQIIVAPLGG